MKRHRSAWLVAVLCVLVGVVLCWVADWRGVGLGGPRAAVRRASGTAAVRSVSQNALMPGTPALSNPTHSTAPDPNGTNRLVAGPGVPVKEYSIAPGVSLRGRATVAQETQPDAAGRFQRVTLVETDLKYPLIRIEDDVRRDAGTGAETLFGHTAMAADHILVKLASGATQRDLELLCASRGARILKKMYAPESYLVAFEAEDVNAVNDAVQDFTAQGAVVAYAEPDFLVYALDTTPSDSRFGHLWGLHNTGQMGGETASVHVQNVATGFAANPMLYAGTTTSNGITGRFRDCGAGQAASFPAEMAGRIAVIRRGEQTFAQMVSNAMAVSASAVVVYNSGSGNFSGALGEFGNWIPAVSISKEDGETLLAMGDAIGTVTCTPHRGADIDVVEAWNITTGDPRIVVAVIDSGVDYSHPDLASNMWVNPGESGYDLNGVGKRANGVDDDGNGLIDDWRGWDFCSDANDVMDGHGHGTHVSGTIGARGDDTAGVVGVCWNVSIVGVRFLNAQGSGFGSDAIDATYYTTRLGVRLTSNSWGGGGASQAQADAIEDACTNGILFMAAAGNSGVDNDNSSQRLYPASYSNRNIIAVAATDHNDGRASFSNYGAQRVDLGAPGANIESTFPGNGHQTWNGTSMATPHVSGVAALLWAFAPDARWDEVKEAILAGTDPVPSLQGKTVTGGRLNAFKALKQLGLHVESSSPGKGDTVTTRPADFSIRFTRACYLPSVDATDLTVNAVPADSVTTASADTVVFHFNVSPVQGQGPQIMHIASNAVTRFKSAGGIVAWTAAFRYDETPLRIAACVPAEGSVAALPLTTIRIAYNEAFDPASVGIDDLVLNQGYVSGVHIVDPQTVEYVLEGVVNEGTLNFRVPAGALTDFWGNPCPASSASLTLDVDTLHWPAVLQAELPLGSMVYTSAWRGMVQTPVDTDTFAVDLDEGQKLTVVADAGAGLQPTITLAGPSNAFLASAFAAAPGDDAVIQSAPISAAGSYAITISSANGTTGSYALRVILNAGIESGQSATNDTRTTAHNLDGTFIALAGAGERGAILGEAATNASSDWFRFNLSSGAVATVVAQAHAPGRVAVDLYDEAGTLRAAGTNGAGVDAYIRDFVAAIQAPYYVRVSGTGSYCLVVARNAEFDLAPTNGFAGAQDLSRTGVLLGRVTGGSNDYARFDASAGDHLVIRTRTPADGPFEFDNPLNPAVELFNPGQTLIASNDNGAADNRNALLFREAATAGSHYVRVRAAQGQGEYVLTAGKAALSLSLPQTAREGDGRITGGGTVAIPAALGSNLLVQLVCDNTAEATVPSAVTLLAGQTTAAFDVVIQDDARLDGTQEAGVQASPPGSAGETPKFPVRDNEATSLGVDVPASATEGEGLLAGRGRVFTAAAVARDARVALASSAPDEVSVPVAVTIPAGTNSVPFDLLVGDDHRLDGAQRVTVSARMDGWTDGSDAMDVFDNDARALWVALPAQAAEGDGTLPYAGRVGLFGSLPSNLVVALASLDISEATVPAAVTIPAGQTSAVFAVTIMEDGSSDGMQTAVVRASAAGFTDGTGSVQVADNSLHHLGFSATVGAQARGVPFSVRVVGKNVDNLTVPWSGGALSFSGVGQAGTATVALVSTGPFTNGEWTGVVRVDTADTNVRLTARDAAGRTGESNPFNVVGPAIAITATNLLNVLVAPGATTARTLTVRNAGNADLTFSIAPPHSAYSPGQAGLLIRYSFDTNAGATVPDQSGNNCHAAVNGAVWTNAGVIGGAMNFSGGSYLQAVSNQTRGLNRLSVSLWFKTTSPGSDYKMVTTARYYGGSSGTGWMIGTLYPELWDTNSTPILVSGGSRTVNFVAGEWNHLAVVYRGSSLDEFINGQLSRSWTATGKTIGDGEDLTVGTWKQYSHMYFRGLMDEVLIYKRALSATEVSRLYGDPLPVYWLSMPPLSGTLAAGAATNVSVTFDAAGLAAGNRREAEFVITCNDAISPANTVFASMDVGTVSPLHLTAPAVATEGDGVLAGRGDVTVDEAVGSDLTVSLGSDDATEVSVPATATIRAGQKRATFDLTIQDDGAADGTQYATITASAAGRIGASAAVAVVDNEAGQLSLAVTNRVSEGQGMPANAATVSISGPLPLPYDLEVTLASGDTSEIVVPPTAIIRAGTLSAPFNVTVADDAVEDGSRTVHLTASAAGFSSATGTIQVADNDVHQFEFGAIAATQTAGVPFSVTVRAEDVNGVVLPSYAGAVALSGAGDNRTAALEPRLLSTFTNGVWGGSATVFTPGENVQLVADDSLGHAGWSTNFQVLPGPLHHFQWSTISTRQLVGQPFQATLVAQDAQGNTVTGFTGSASLSCTGFLRYATGPGANLGFEQGLASWSTLNLSDWPGPYQTGWFDANGDSASSYAFRISPNRGTPDGIFQDISLQGGVEYRFDMDAAATVPSYEASFGSAGWVRLFIGGQMIASNYFGQISFGEILRAHMQGAFVPATSGPYRLTITFQREPVPDDQYVWLYVDDLQIRRAPQQMSLTPTVTGGFQAGAWTGSIRINEAVTNGALLAQSGGCSGQSGLFNVLNSPAIRVTPRELATVYVVAGHTVNRTVTIENIGIMNLSFDATEFIPEIHLDDLLVHLSFDNDAAGVVHDDSGNGNNGTVYGSQAPYYGYYQTAPGKIGMAFDFDGNHRIECDDNAALDSPPLTLALWAKSTIAPPAGSLIYKGGGNLPGFSMNCTGGRAYFSLQGGGGSCLLTASNTLNANEWYALVATADGTNQRLYVNGELAASGVGGGALGRNCQELRTGHGWKGGIDDVRVYKRALSAGEVRSLYNMGRDWFRVQPQSGSVGVGGQVVLTATYDAQGFPAEVEHQEGKLLIKGNTELCPVVPVPVSMAIFPPLAINVPASASEGDGLLVRQGSVDLPFASPSSVVVALSSGDPAEVAVPASVTVAAGATNAAFDLTVLDDAVLDGTQCVLISASDPGYGQGSQVIAVRDNETTALALSVPATASEEDGVLASAGIVSSGAAVGKAVPVSLSSDRPDVVVVPASVTIAAGTNSVRFDLTIMENNRIDGTLRSTITAHVDNWTEGSAAVDVLDDEHTQLVVTLPAEAREDAGVLTNAGAVRISGILASNLVVTLASDDTSELLVPASVTISSGSTSAVFSVTAVHDNLCDGRQTALVRANAPGFVEGRATMGVLDVDLDHFAFADIGSPQARGAPFAVSIAARDMNGAAVPYTGTVSLSASADGSAINVQPVTLPMTNGQWIGSVRIGESANNVRLIADDHSGHVGQSGIFSVTGPEISVNPTNLGALVVAPDSTIGRVLTIRNHGNENLVFDISTAASIVPTNGLLLYYPFRTNAGTRVYDRSTNGCNALAINNAMWVSNGVTGGAFQFTNYGTVNGFLQVDRNPTRRLASLGVSLWFKTPTPSYDLKLITTTAWGRYHWGYGWSGWMIGTLYPEIWGTNGQPVLVSGEDRRFGFLTNEWNHLAITYSGSTANEFINGQLSRSWVANGMPISDGGDLQIGAWLAMGINGLIDEVVVCNRALSTNEVTALHAMRPRWFLPQSSSGVLPPGGSTNIVVTVDSHGVADDHQESVTMAISCNDAVSPLIQVPLCMRVSSRLPILDSAEGATDVTAHSATLNAQLVSTGGAPTHVSVHWGTTDPGKTASGWGHVASLGQCGVGSLNTSVAGLISGENYYYRFYATNAAGEAWADPAEQFQTAIAPAVDNNGGAVQLTPGTARLNGNLTQGGNADARIYWGTADPGRTAVGWDHVETLGQRNEGPLSAIVAGLMPGVWYCYRVHATNSEGEAWADPAVRFRTEGAPAVDNDGGATEITPSSARLRGNLTQGGSAAIWVYWGRTDGGTNALNWGHTNYLGELGEGSFACRLTGLIPATSYRYRCYAQNAGGMDWADSTALFTTTLAGPFATCTYKMKITFTGYGGPETLTNFPALVVLSEGLNGFHYGQFRLAGGGDLRFGSEGTPLNYEIERWDTNGESCVWVQVPRLAGTSTAIYAYWGDPNASASAACTTNGATWDPSFRGVWHLNETAGHHLDATSNRFDSTIESVTAQGMAAGRIDGADQFNAIGDRVEVPALNLNTNQATVMAWVKGRQISDYAGIVVSRSGSSAVGILSCQNQLRYMWNGARQDWMSDLVIPGEQWALVALVVDAAGATLYVNGTSATDPRPVANEDFDGPTTFGVDPSDQANRRWAGLIDEVRIENVPRSRDWIRACYLNQVAGSTFGSYSPVEGNGVPGMDVDGDGIDDGWETSHFRDTTAADATTDSDGDGFPDLFEFIAGTDPTNPASRLAVSELGVGSGGWAIVKWQSVVGKVYTVERGTNLLGDWSVREPGILGTPPVNAYTDAAENVLNANYRVKVDP